MSLKTMPSVGNYLGLLLVLGASVLSGCRSNKSDFSFASPRQPTPIQASLPLTSAVPQTGVVPDSLPVMTPPPTAPSYSTPAAPTYAPMDFSPTPKKSSGCSSGCCSG
jgi:hypothetical protein